MSATPSLDQVIEEYASNVPRFIEKCTSPDATDMAALLADLRACRERLQAVERDVEEACGKAMVGDHAEGHGVRVERHRRRDRKEWDHPSWRHDVRDHVLRRNGLLGAQAVITADGEPVEVSLNDVLAQTQDAQGAGPPKLTALRALGLDASDYCQTLPGTWALTVTRLADEEKTA